METDMDRAYESSHPWLRFSLDLRPAAPRLWMLLGEAASKCEHIAAVPLEPATAERLHLLYLAKGVLATTAIEGNTLTEQEVLAHLEGKLHLPKSKEYLGQEIDNIVRACNDLPKAAAEGAAALTADRVCLFNRQVLEGLNVERGVVPGEIRRHSVTVGRYRGAPAEDCRYLLDRLCAWLESRDFAPQPGLELVYAILKAIVGHVYLARIHPFGDGNGRTARLMEFQVLMVAGVPTPAAHLLSNHYNQTRAEYYRQLDSASRSGGDLLPFIEYAVQGFVDGLRAQIEVVREQQWEVAWRDFVYRSFGANPPAPQARQCQLVLALGGEDGFVAVEKLKTLSVALAATYARRSSKALQRDVAEVVRRGLVERTEAGVRARKELILAFLPWRQRA
jgi:Fic family protein